MQIEETENCLTANDILSLVKWAEMFMDLLKEFPGNDWRNEFCFSISHGFSESEILRPTQLGEKFPEDQDLVNLCRSSKNFLLNTPEKNYAAFFVRGNIGFSCSSDPSVKGGLVASRRKNGTAIRLRNIILAVSGECPQCVTGALVINTALMGGLPMKDAIRFIDGSKNIMAYNLYSLASERGLIL